MKYKSIIKALLFSQIFLSPSLMAQNTDNEGAQTETENAEDLNKIVNVAFGQVNKEKLVSSVSSVKPADRIVYDNTQWVRDYIDGLLLGVRGSGNIRGFNSEALFVIDGIPGRDINMLITSEIEEITVLKDVSAMALYGSQARNGVILITTKRGKANQKNTYVNLNFGLSAPVALPKYLGAAEYMETYNEAWRNAGNTSDYYDSELIKNTASGVNPYKYPDIDFFSDEYVRQYTPNGNVSAEFTGGTEKVQYYVNMAYKYDGNMVKINPSVNKGSNMFKVRGNIDFKANDYIKSGVDVVTVINSQKTAHTNIMDAGTSFLPNWYSPLLPVSMIDESLKDKMTNIKVYDGFILGGSNQYKDKVPFGDIYAKGYKRNEYKNVQVGNTIDFDLRNITEGLSAKTYLSLDYYDASTVSINNDFNYYEPVWEGDKIIDLKPLGKPDKKDLTENISTTGYRIRYGFSGQVDYKRTFAEKHSVYATALAFYNAIQNKGVKQIDLMGHFGLRLNYDYMSKYLISLTGIQNYSIKLPEGNRGGFAPTFGLGYVLSNEEFMKDVDWLNFLKLRFSAGTIKTDLGISQYFMYDDIYNINDGSYSWNDGTKSQQVSSSQRGSNILFGFEERKELALGLDAQLFNSLWFETSFFRNDITNQVTRLTNSVYPSFYGDFIPYSNYNEDRYKGFEMGLRYNKKIGDFNLAVGANLLYVETEALKRDEVYEYDYQYRVGRSLSAIYGLQADGLYTAEDFDAEGNLKEGLPKPQFGKVYPGDVKYLDHNGDNIIDDNDQHQIGRWDQPINYSFNVKLNYKNFTLFVLADGQNGGDAMLSNSYYQSDGTDKYSEFIRNRWTEENPDPNAIVPRITSGSATNNFKSSTYWMYDNSFFRINRAQLTYEFNKDFVKRLGMSGLSIDIAGSNLLQFAKNKQYRELSVGAWPQKRYYTIGLRMTL